MEMVILNIKKFIKLFIVIIFIFNSARVYSAQNTWKTSQSISDNNFNSVTHAGDKIDVAVGDQGLIEVSRDGGVWSVAKSGTDENLNKVVWNGNKFITIGDNGTILTSADGVKWTNVESGISQSLIDIVCVKNRCLIIGTDNIVLTSNDLKKWRSTEINIRSDCSVSSIIWAGNQYVAVAHNGIYDDDEKSQIITSKDGHNWKYNNFNGILNTIAYNGKIYIALGNNLIVTSKNGNKWSTSAFMKLSSDAFGIDVQQLIWNGKIFVGVGINTNDSSSCCTMTSKDGVKWRFSHFEHETFCFENINDLIWTGKGFIAVSDGFSGGGIPYGAILESKDGYTWKIERQGADFEFLDLSWDGKRCIVVGLDNILLTSNDGINFNVGTTEVMGSYNTFDYILYDGEKFQLSIYDNTKNIHHIYISQDGVNWNSVYTPVKVTNYMKSNYSAKNCLEVTNGIIFDGKNYIALGFENYINLSESEISIDCSKLNAVDEKQRTLYTVYKGLVSNGEKYTTLGFSSETGTFYAANSQDAKKWTVSKANINVKGYSNCEVNKLIYAKGKYLAITTGYINEEYHSLLLESSDSINWYPVYDYKNTLTSIAYNGNNFVAVGNGIILNSTNGTNWTINDIRINYQLSKVKWINNKFYALGDNGVLLSSEDGTTWNAENIASCSLVDIASSGKRIVIFASNGEIIFKDIK